MRKLINFPKERTLQGWCDVRACQAEYVVGAKYVYKKRKTLAVRMRHSRACQLFTQLHPYARTHKQKTKKEKRLCFCNALISVFMLRAHPHQRCRHTLQANAKNCEIGKWAAFRQKIWAGRPQTNNRRNCHTGDVAEVVGTKPTHVCVWASVWCCKEKSAFSCANSARQQRIQN